MSINTLIFAATYNEAENIIDYLKKGEQLNLNADVVCFNSHEALKKVIESIKK